MAGRVGTNMIHIIRSPTGDGELAKSEFPRFVQIWAAIPIWMYNAFVSTVLFAIPIETQAPKTSLS